MAALGWILRESNKGGYLPPLFFLLQFHESSWKCFFLGFKYILLKRKYAFQSLNWSMRAECLGRWPLCCWGLSQWTSGRPSSSGMQYTTCLGSPCHTPCDISCPLPSAFSGWLSLEEERTRLCVCAASAHPCSWDDCVLETLECLWRWLEEIAKKCWSCCHLGWTWLILEWSQGAWPDKHGPYARGRGWWELSGSRASSVSVQFWHKEFLLGSNLGWGKWEVMPRTGREKLGPGCSTHQPLNLCSAWSLYSRNLPLRRCSPSPQHAQDEWYGCVSGFLPQYSAPSHNFSRGI